VTLQDKNILTKELRGITWGNIITVVVMGCSAVGFGVSHYNGIMGKLNEIDAKVALTNNNMQNLQKEVDRHEQLLLTAKK